MYVYNRILICRTERIIWKEVADFCISRRHNRYRQLIINYANNWFHNSIQFWNLFCFLERKKASLWHRHALCVFCVLMAWSYLFQLFNQLTDIYETVLEHHVIRGHPPESYFWFPTFNNNSMADTQTCEVWASLAPHILWSWNYVYIMGRSRCPRGLRGVSAAARFLGLRVPIPPGAWMSCLLWVFCVVW